MLDLVYTYQQAEHKVGLELYYDPEIRLTQAFLFPNATEEFQPIIGDAYCHDSDQFDKKTGRKIAFKRAVENYTEVKEHRAALWGAFMQKVRLR